jgi:hypothetical protein
MNYLKFGKKRNIKGTMIWALVAHTCNPSYAGGRDQEDCGFNPISGK